MTSIIVTSVCVYAVFSISSMTIKYCSTRGGESGVRFIDVLLNGMARDGGLYIPEEIPKIENFGEICKGKTYREICMFIFSLFIHEDEISRFELAQVINEAYAHFKVAEVVEANENVVEGICVLELFHGPTFAFKDVALQLLGGLFSLVLKKKQRKPVTYERIDDKNVRIGTTWFYYVRRLLLIEGRQELSNGVTIYGEGFKRFIANSWYTDEDIAML